MGFMEYANYHQCNIIPQEEFEELVTEVFGVIATNISRSLGPLGSSATILNGMMTEATKDGYSILSNYRFNNKYKRLVLNLIKAPCTKMNNTVGDGTTTVIALTNALFQRYRNQEKSLYSLYRLPRELTKCLDSVVEEIIEQIQKRAQPLDPTDYDKVFNLAYVVSNGNKEVSSQIAKVYAESKSPVIKLKDSPTNRSYIEAVEGFSFPANAIDSIYVTNEDLSATEQDVMTMLFGQKITRDLLESIIVPVSKVAHLSQKKLLVIAPSYDDYMCETVLGQFANAEIRQFGSVNTLMLQYRMADIEQGQRDDLAVILRSKTINQLVLNDIKEAIQLSPEKFVSDAYKDPSSPMYRMLGHADTAFISCTNGSIFTSQNIEQDEAYQQALKNAQAELDAIVRSSSMERQSYSHKIYDARARVLQLQMKNYVYYIGADSELQKQILWDSIEDVVKCMRSAIRCGVVPGCQLTIINVCKKLLNKCDETTPPLRTELLTMIMSACMEVYEMVLHGPDKHGLVKMIKDWNTAYQGDEGAAKLAATAVELGYNIIGRSITENRVFDLETRTFNPNIITSAETDVMVLRAATELVKILISGNQCIYVDEEINSTHQETKEVYV